MRLIDYSAVNGWRFELVVQNDGDDVFYQCRGEVMYDDEHDRNAGTKSLGRCGKTR